MSVRVVYTLFAQTFREAIRTKWLIGFTVVFLLLAINIPDLIAITGGYLPISNIENFLVTLVSGTFPILPLLALPLSSLVIADERESGTLEYIMSHPISRFEFILGRLLGMSFATSLVIVMGYGLAAAIAFSATTAGWVDILETLAIAVMLNIVMVGIGMTVSVISKSKITALMIVIFLWYSLTAVANVSYTAFLVTLIGGPWLAVPFILLNPIQLATTYVFAIQKGGSLAAQGPVGNLLQHIFGVGVINLMAASLIIWLVFFVALALLLFTRQDLA